MKRIEAGDPIRSRAPSPPLLSLPYPCLPFSVRMSHSRDILHHWKAGIHLSGIPRARMTELAASSTPNPTLRFPGWGARVECFLALEFGYPDKGTSMGDPIL